jgi:hypothetical protein
MFDVNLQLVNHDEKQQYLEHILEIENDVTMT